MVFRFRIRVCEIHSVLVHAPPDAYCWTIPGIAQSVRKYDRVWFGDCGVVSDRCRKYFLNLTSAYLDSLKCSESVIFSVPPLLVSYGHTKSEINSAIEKVAETKILGEMSCEVGEMRHNTYFSGIKI